MKRLLALLLGITLKPGMEVAQVDWDGATARVDWTTVNSVVTGEGTPRLELADGVESGASGGGVFWQGYHVATNWMLREYLDGTSGVVIRQASTAALNSEWVARRVSELFVDSKWRGQETGHSV